MQKLEDVRACGLLLGAEGGSACAGVGSGEVRRFTRGHPARDPAHHIKSLGLGFESFGKPLQALKETSR